MPQVLLLDLHLQCHSHHLLWLPGRSPWPHWPQLPGQCCQPPMASQTMGIPCLKGQVAGKGTYSCHQRWLWGRTQVPGNGAEQGTPPIGGREDAGGGGCPCMGPQHRPPLPCSATRHVWPSTAACATRASPTGSPSLCSPCSFACSSTPSLVTPAPSPSLLAPRVPCPLGSSILLRAPLCCSLHTAHPHLPVSRALWLPDLRRGCGVRCPDVLPRK